MGDAMPVDVPTSGQQNPARSLLADSNRWSEHQRPAASPESSMLGLPIQSEGTPQWRAFCSFSPIIVYPSRTKTTRALQFARQAGLCALLTAWMWRSVGGEAHVAGVRTGRSGGGSWWTLVGIGISGGWSPLRWEHCWAVWSWPARPSRYSCAETAHGAKIWRRYRQLGGELADPSTPWRRLMEVSRIYDESVLPGIEREMDRSDKTLERILCLAQEPRAPGRPSKRKERERWRAARAAEKAAQPKRSPGRPKEKRDYIRRSPFVLTERTHEKLDTWGIR